MDTPAPRNRLARETSAYLLQHAGNPVDWYPWGDEALERARTLDRPILLSIGYSACHWCHVMERESFEDPDIAALMNEHFVCIKVDREERPDVDHLYMKALQGMTGRGGWPMTMFLTPDARPFYAGTYFPPEDRGGMPGFPRVLLGVAKTWKERPGEVDQSAGKVLAFLAEGRADARPGGLDEAALEEACDSLVSAMDAEHGGFGRAPKFPGTMALVLLMEAERVRTVPARRALLERTLDRMAAGGIRDHLGGGFHRYSVDRVWLVPHFEKMLYDQALLAGLYTDAFLFFGDQAWAAVSGEILDHVVAEMTSADGGFFAAQDADSEGEEGRFFVWSREEVLDVLGEDRGSRFCETYGVREGGNFEGRSILHRPAGDDGGLILGGRAGRGEDAGLAEDRCKLLARRRLRVAPDTDRKILTDWNGLMISAMARGGQALDRPDFIDAAARAARFVRRHLQDSTGLLHVYADGKAKVPAFLDDHAFFGRACLDLHAVRPGGDFLEGALRCAGELLEGFVDEAGGFCFTGSRGESLVARTSDLYDGPVPAGNSVAAELLLRLWSLTGNEDFRRAGQAVLDRFLGDALRNPYGGCHLLAVADRHRRGWRTVVVLGEDQARESLARTARQVYDPACTVLSIGRAEEASRIPVLSGKTAPAHGAAAYLCEGSTCSLPLTSPSELRDTLEDGLAAGPAAGEDLR